MTGAAKLERPSPPGVESGVAWRMTTAARLVDIVRSAGLAKTRGWPTDADEVWQTALTLRPRGSRIAIMERMVVLSGAETGVVWQKTGASRLVDIAG